MTYNLMKVFHMGDMAWEAKNNYEYDYGDTDYAEVCIEPSSSGLSKVERSYKKWLIDNGASPGETVLVIK